MGSPVGHGCRTPTGYRQFADRPWKKGAVTVHDVTGTDLAVKWFLTGGGRRRAAFRGRATRSAPWPKDISAAVATFFTQRSGYWVQEGKLVAFASKT